MTKITITPETARLLKEDDRNQLFAWIRKHCHTTERFVFKVIYDPQTRTASVHEFKRNMEGEKFAYQTETGETEVAVQHQLTYSEDFPFHDGLPTYLTRS